MRRLREWVIRAPRGTVRYWVSLTMVVSRIAADRRARLKMIFAGLTAPFRDRLPWQSVMKSRLRIGDLRVDWWLGPSSDFEVLHDVFTHGEYDLPLAEPQVIFDLGSHMGATLLYFRARFPRALIIGVEPDPHTLPRLRRNAAQLGVKVLEVALTSEDGDVAFYPARQGWASSLHPSGTKSVTVKGRALDTLLDESELDAIDLLKIDIEGAEDEVLRASSRLPDIGAIVGDFHGDEGARETFSLLLSNYFDVEIEGSHRTFKAIRRCHPNSDPPRRPS
jgi:FkbM family methyltransferase